MLKHAIRSKGQTISFISNSNALFKLHKFFLGTGPYLVKETGDVKSHGGKESANIASTTIANISLIKSHISVLECLLEALNYIERRDLRFELRGDQFHISVNIHIFN